MKPLLLLLRIFGRFPYSFNERGIEPFKILSFPALYTAVFFIVQTVWTVFSFCIICQEKIYRSANYDETLYWASIILFLLLNFTVPFTSWVEAPKISEYVILWKNFQEDYMEPGLELTMAKAVRVVAFLILPLCLCFMSFESYLLTDLSTAAMIPYVTALGSSMTMLFVWCTTLHELRSASKQLLSKIIMDECRKMSSHRRTWLSLSRLVSGVGDVNGYSGLAVSTLLFVSFVLTMYAVLSTLFEFREITVNFWGLVIGACLGTVSNFILCNSAHLTTQEVGANFSSKILSLDMAHLSQNNINELCLLLQAMSANPPIVEFLGFVTINRGLFVSFVSNTVTYLVVLIQFKAASPDNGEEAKVLDAH